MKPSGRIRSIATAVVIAAALLGTLATTPPRATLGNSATGQPLLLGPGDPVARVRFTFEANAAAFDERESLGVRLHYEPFWSGIPGSSTPELLVDLVKLSGPALPEWELSDLGCGWTPRCVGAYEATFRWPAALAEGAVRVEWSVSGEISYDRAEPPAGAEASVRLEPRQGSPPAPVRVFESTFPLGRDKPIVSQRVRVTLGEEVADRSALAIELDTPHVPTVEPGVLVVLLQDGRSPHRLFPSTSTSLDLPERCTAGPCSFSFSLVTNLRPPNNDHSGWVTWALTLPEPSAGIEVWVEGQQVPRISDSIALGAMDLVGQSRGDPITVSVRIPKAALPTQEIGDSAPVIQARLRLNVVADTLVFPEEGRLDAEIAFSAAPPEASRVLTIRPSWYEESILATDPVAFIVPNGCAAESPCEVSLMLTFTTAGSGSSFEGGFVGLRPTVEVLLGYPIGGEVPEGADLVLASRSGT
jgi:hypothetical protein